MDLSVILPVYDEAGSVPQLCEELENTLAGTPLTWEVIFVDDGSRDGTAEVLKEAVAERGCFRLLTFAQNRGQSAALVAGIRAASGEVIVTLDADLQNDPADIPKLLEKMSESGADAVSGIRRRRRDSLARRIASVVANRARNLVLRDGVTDVGCSLKCYRAKFLRDLPAFDGIHRYLPAIVRARGARIVEIEVSHRPRRYGTSKYNISGRLVRGIHDLIGVRWLLSRQVDLTNDE